MTSSKTSALRGFPWYPTLIGFIWVSAVYVDYPVPFETAPRILLFTAAIGIIVTAAWVALLGRDRGGVAAAVTLMGLVAASDPARLLLFALAIGLLLVERSWSASGRMRLRVPWGTVTRTLNIFLVVFVAIQVGRSVQAANSYPIPPTLDTWKPGPLASAPDIFLIIADGHGRRDVLRDSYGYGSEAFAAAMRQAEFQESDSAHSNHTETKYSLSVMLNGRPLSELGQDMSMPGDPVNAYGAVLHNSTFPLLARAGYDTTVVWSGYDHLSLRNADRFIDTGRRNEPETVLWAASAVGRALDELTGSYVSDVIARIDGQFETLKGISSETNDRPQFVLVHIPSPHPPFVFDAQCLPRRPDAMTTGAPGRGYGIGSDATAQLVAEQTECIDARLAAALTNLVKARPDAVVLVLSDHGPEERLNWLQPDPEAVADRLATLFWARTPGRERLFPKDVSLVNVVPIIANAYLDTDLPLHPDSAFFMPIRGYFSPAATDRSD